MPVCSTGKPGWDRELQEAGRPYWPVVAGQPTMHFSQAELTSQARGQQGDCMPRAGQSMSTKVSRSTHTTINWKSITCRSPDRRDRWCDKDMCVCVARPPIYGVYACSTTRGVVLSPATTPPVSQRSEVMRHYYCRVPQRNSCEMNRLISQDPQRNSPKRLDLSWKVFLCITLTLNPYVSSMLYPDIRSYRFLYIFFQSIEFKMLGHSFSIFFLFIPFRIPRSE